MIKPYLFLSCVGDEEHIIDDTESTAGIRHDNKRPMEGANWVAICCGLFVDSVHRQNNHGGLEVRLL